MLIRQASACDCQAISDIFKSAFSPFENHYTPMAYANTVVGIDVIKHRMDNGISWIAEENGEPIGTVSATPTWEGCSFVLAESTGSKNGVFCQTQNVAAMELCLSYEEAGEVVMAWHVAQCCIESGIGCWTDAYQRPGYLYMGEDNSTQPFISADDPNFPSWCRALERESDTILEEFLALVGGSRSSCSSDIVREIAVDARRGRGRPHIVVARDSGKPRS